MRYSGQNIDDGEYYAATYSDAPNIALILPDRDNGRLDKTTYSDAAGNSFYETSIFRVKIRNGKVRRT